jgi:chitinase
LPVTTTTTSSSSMATTATTLSTITGSTTATSSPTPTGALVPHWGQCAGKDYMGPTQCEPPYTCVFVGDWWSHCA